MQLPRTVWILLIGAVIAIALYIFISSVFPLLLPLVIGVLAFISGVYVGRRSAGVSIGRGRAQAAVEGRVITRAASKAPTATERKAVPAEAKPTTQPQANAVPAAAAAPSTAKQGEKFEWESWSDSDTSADVPSEKEILGRLAEKEKEAANPEAASAPTDVAQAALLERKRRLGLLKD